MTLDDIPTAQPKHTPSHPLNLGNEMLNEPQELAVVTETPNLETMARADVPAIFAEFETQAQPLLEKANQLAITPDNQLVIADVAGNYRKQIKAVRCATEKRRKELVEGIKRHAKQIDAAAGIIWDACERAEAKLVEIEEFAERQEQKRLDDLVAFRSAAVKQAEGNPAHYNLREMSEEEFNEMVGNLCAGLAARKEAAIKAKQEQEAREKAEAEAREAQRLENERLKAEAAERERLAEIERREAAAKLKAEQEAARIEREKIEAEAKAERERAAARQREIEQKAEQERAEAKRKADEALAKAEAARVAAAKKAQAEREAIEAKAREEKRLADEAAAAERRKREALEAEIAEQKRKDAERQEAEAAAAKAAEAAPDVDKFVAWVEKMLHTEFPEVKSPELDELLAELNGKLHHLLRGFEERAKALSKPKRGHPKGAKAAQDEIPF